MTEKTMTVVHWETAADALDPDNGAEQQFGEKIKAHVDGHQSLDWVTVPLTDFEARLLKEISAATGVSDD